MPPVTRKRSAPAPLLSASSESEYEPDLEIMLKPEPVSSSTEEETNSNSDDEISVSSNDIIKVEKLKKKPKPKFKCPWKECERTFRLAHRLEAHCLSHEAKDQKTSPSKGGFSLFNALCADKSHLKKQIRYAHKVSTSLAKKYIKELKKALDKELEQLKPKVLTTNRKNIPEIESSEEGSCFDDANSSVEDDLTINNTDNPDETVQPSNNQTTKSQQVKGLNLKCPWESCDDRLPNASYLRRHYRKHTSDRPYRCSFESCGQTKAQLQLILRHIRKDHGQEKFDAKKYVEVNKKILDEEARRLGIKEYYTEKVYKSKVSAPSELNLNSSTSKPTSKVTQTQQNISLPFFTTIYQTSTSLYICPLLSGCNAQRQTLAELRRHYRVHGGAQYRPYRCNVSPGVCQYASSLKKNVISHIKFKHGQTLQGSEDVGNNSNIYMCTELLAMEEALFSNATIVSPPKVEIQKPLTFGCSYEGCNRTAAQKSDVLRHIYAAHFSIPRNEHKNLGSETKARAEQFVRALGQKDLGQPERTNDDKVDILERAIAGISDESLNFFAEVSEFH